MSPVVTATRIQPAVSRFTISHPTKLSAAISQTTATSRKLKDFTGRDLLLDPGGSNLRAGRASASRAE
ncbi:MAG TPA: hypothetical protein VJX92_21530 [Methylomirabilota bacterium]|nr:hypothetical protein [Methylomirabilota bacterium]